MSKPHKQFLIYIVLISLYITLRRPSLPKNTNFVNLLDNEISKWTFGCKHPLNLVNFFYHVGSNKDEFIFFHFTENSDE